jgi:hypothetical protein
LRWAGIAILGLLLALGPGCADDVGLEESRAQRIEQQLLASCSCHPRKIEGLEIERQIRTAIASLIDQGLDDDAILWSVLQQHGAELLSAGVEDVELRARVAFIEVGGILLVAGGVLLLQLRRREESG